MNGNDAAWQAKRKLARQALNQDTVDNLAPYSNVDGRFRDNDELRYSLRALERFFPHHGHIYLVTDAQTPAWLKPHAGLTVIDHRDLMPAAQLPVFDSGNIESYIHRIPDLSERFFYCNDDVFFGAPVALDEWFYDGGIVLTWSDDPVVEGSRMMTESTALVNASRWSQQWLEQSHKGSSQDRPAIDASYLHTPRTFAHSPRPMLKSIMKSLERIAPERFAAVRSTVFRAWDKPTIVSDFVLRWALATGQAQLRDHRHLHISTGDAQLTQALAQLAQRIGELDFFCLNDTLDDVHAQDPRLAQVRAALAAVLPKQSVFEKNQSMLLAI